MSEPQGDVLMVCVESGLVRILESVLRAPDNGPAEIKTTREALAVGGAAWRVKGRPCPVCLDRDGARTCEYRPLRGPLFVPR